MATFELRNVSQCAGGNHLHAEVRYNGGAWRDIQFTRDEIEDAADLDPRALAIARLRSAIKEADARTPAQRKAAIEGKVFQV